MLITTLVTNMIYIIIISVLGFMAWAFVLYKTVRVARSNYALENTLAELREKNNAN